MRARLLPTLGLLALVVAVPVQAEEWEEVMTRWNFVQFDLPAPPSPAH